MVRIKVQSKKVYRKGQEIPYQQYMITLPKKVCEAIRLQPGDYLEVFVERGDLVLRKE